MRKKYKPKGVRVDALNWVLSGIKPLNSAPYSTTLRIRNHSAMDIVTHEYRAKRMRPIVRKETV